VGEHDAWFSLRGCHDLLLQLVQGTTVETNSRVAFPFFLDPVGDVSHGVRSAASAPERFGATADTG
jgi:hypothetical protein